MFEMAKDFVRLGAGSTTENFEVIGGCRWLPNRASGVRRLRGQEDEC